jgi:hypothetical protein
MTYDDRDPARYSRPWRVTAPGADPVYFATERGARTAYALTYERDPRTARPVVEHLGAHDHPDSAPDGWHVCPTAAELLIELGTVGPIIRAERPPRRPFATTSRYHGRRPPVSG